jgi:hypothetical protein
VLALSIGHASALVGSDFKPGRIIDDAVFYDKNSMSVADIQAFLQSKISGGSCDTNGARPISSGSSLTRAQAYGQPGYSWISHVPPYVCLTDYYENVITHENNLRGRAVPTDGKRASQIIYDAAQTWGISPKVLLVMLQKESEGPLITDDWPLERQYKTSMGYGCPDTAPCDTQYFGFFNQMNNAARQFRLYTNNPNAYSYRPGAGNFIYWNPSASCGGASVSIENQATANLYNYTPYQPNVAALANLNGAGDSCSAYGNRNFWSFYNNWFGATVNLEDDWTLSRNVSNGRVLLTTKNSMYYVPDVATIHAWGLDNEPIYNRTQEYFVGKSEGPPLNRLASDKYGNLFLVDEGRRHYVSNYDLLNLYGISPSSAVVVQGLLSKLEDSKWVGHCVSSEDMSQEWVVDKAARNTVPSHAYYEDTWGCTVQKNIPYSNWFLNQLGTGVELSRTATSGDSTYLVDSGRLYADPVGQKISSLIESASLRRDISPNLKNLLASMKPNNFLVEGVGDGMWYVLEGSHKHYVSSGGIAALYTGQSPLKLAQSTVDAIPRSGDMGSLIETSVPSMYYIMDGGKKRHIPSVTELREWASNDELPIQVDVEFAKLFESAEAVQSPVAMYSNGYYVLQNGSRSKVSGTHRDNWSSSQIGISQALFMYLKDDGRTLEIVAKSKPSEDIYLLGGGVKRKISPAFLQAWHSEAVPEILDLTLARYPTSTDIATPVVTQDGKYFGLSSLKYAELSPGLVPLLNTTPTQLSTLDLTPDKKLDSYLLVSGDNVYEKSWLVTIEGLQELPSLAYAYNYGEVSKSIQRQAVGDALISVLSKNTKSPKVSKFWPSIVVAKFRHSISIYWGHRHC